MTSSKNLQTKLTEAGNLDCNADSPAQRDSNARHDARLAHEMLPVLRQLVEQLNVHECYYPDGDGPCLGCAALAAAAPFVQED